MSEQHRKVDFKWSTQKRCYYDNLKETTGVNSTWDTANSRSKLGSSMTNSHTNNSNKSTEQLDSNKFPK